MTNPLSEIVAEIDGVLTLIDFHQPVIGGVWIQGTQLRNWRDRLQAIDSGARTARVGPIGRDGGREFIPLPGGWEIHTKGEGSSFRIVDLDTGDRLAVPDSPYLHDTLTNMAREIHGACTNYGAKA